MLCPQVVQMQMQISRIIADGRGGGAGVTSNSGHGPLTSRTLSPTTSRNYSRTLSQTPSRTFRRSMSSIEGLLPHPIRPLDLILSPCTAAPVHSNSYDGARSSRSSSTTQIPRASNLSKVGCDSARVTDALVSQLSLQRQAQTVCSSVSVTPRQMESARASADGAVSSPREKLASWTERLHNSVTRIMPSIKAKERAVPTKSSVNLQQGYMRLVNLLKSSTDTAQTLPDVVRGGVHIPRLRLPVG